jgi:hypothetical protein
VNEDIKRLAADELAKIDQHSRSLEQLRDDPTFRLLRDARLSGVTSERWAAASRAIASVMSRLEKSRKAVDDATRLLLASPNDAGKAEQLLRGRSVPLTPAEIPKPDRRPPASNSSAPRFTLHAVRDFAADDLRLAQRVVEDVAAVLAAARPRLEQLTARMEEASSGHGHAAAGGPGAERAGLRAELEDTRRLLASDPLALRPRGVAAINGHLDLSRLEAIELELTRLTADVGRLDRLRAAVNELDKLESQARSRRDALLKRFAGDGRPPVPAAAGGLASHVAALETQWLDAEADELDRAVAAATLAATEVTQCADDAFKQWDLLRELLEDYQIRATRLGFATRSELVAVHHRARQLLDAVPCDLPLADQAVHEYMSMEQRRWSENEH